MDEEQFAEYEYQLALQLQDYMIQCQDLGHYFEIRLEQLVKNVKDDNF